MHQLFFPNRQETLSLYVPLIIFTGPIHRIETGPRLGTARVIYYNKTSSKAAEDELHYSELDGMTIIVRKPSIRDQKDTFKSSAFPIGRRAFSAGSPMTSNFGNGIPNGGGDNRIGTVKKSYNYASGHRATCGVGYIPYGLSAQAEPFEPATLASTTADQAGSQSVPSNIEPLTALTMMRSVSQPIKLSDPCQLIIQNVPLDLNAQSFYISLRNTFLSTCPNESMKLLEATVALDAATGESQGIAFIRLENRIQSDIAFKVLNDVHLVDYEEREGLMPLRVKSFDPKGFIERGLQLRQLSNGIKSLADKSDTTPNNGFIEKHSPLTSPSTTSSSKVASPNQTKHLKHRKLLSTALDDLEESISSSLFTKTNEKERMLDLLVAKLPEEERKRCILEEKYLKKKCEALKVLYWDDDDEVGASQESLEIPQMVGREAEQVEKSGDDPAGKTQEESKNRAGSESPTRVYDKRQLLDVSEFCRSLII